MPIQRPSLDKTIIQIELNRFYEKPVTRISVALILTLISISFFALAAIRPTLQTMAQLLKQIDEKKTLDTQLSQKIQALTVAQKNLLEKEPLFPALAIAIPPSANFSTLMTVIEKVASENQVVFNSAQIQKVPLEEKINITATGRLNLVSYPITLSFSGSYENLINTMKKLQSLKRIIVVDRFDVSNQKSDQATENVLTLTMSVRAFSFHTGATIPSATTN
jgi:Tfp pilus assembly protein PilO